MSSGDRRRKSYWQAMYLGSEHARTSAKSWFMPMCEGMEPYKADILCDIETDREKKIRVLMMDEHGGKWSFERTMGRNFTITRKPVTDTAPVRDVSGGTK